MAEERLALIIATGEYQDPKLAQLRAPAADAQRLATVLANKDIGDFRVEVAKDEDERSLRLRLAQFLASGRPDDLLLLHISCHGIKDDRGRLYLAAADTQIDYPDVTAISAEWLDDRMSYGRARRTVLLLDCCFAGRFPFGMRRRAGEDVGLSDHLGGRGRAVLSASSAMEYAYEGDELSDKATGSVFTTALVEGLESGEADQDRDSWISVDDLYGYIYDRVRADNPAQTPTRQGSLEGDFYVARSVYEPLVEPAQLDEELLELVEHRMAGARLGAVEELSALLGSSNRDIALAARLTLERMLDDDSRQVAAHATAALAGVAARDEQRPSVPPTPAQLETKPPRKIKPRQGSPKVVAHASSALAGVAARDEQRPLVPTTPAQLETKRPLQIKARQGAPKPARQIVQVRPMSERGWAGVDATSTGDLLDREAEISDVALGPDGRRMATASPDGTARVWEVDGGREVVSVKSVHPYAGIDVVAFSPDGRQIATGDRWTVQVWEVDSGREVTRLEPAGNSLVNVAFSPDGQQIATANSDGRVLLWDVDKARQRRRKIEHDRVFAVSFSPDGQRIGSAGHDGTARVWNVNGGREVANVPHETVLSGVAFSPDGKRFATAANDKTVRVWDVDTSYELSRLNHDQYIVAAAFSSDIRRVAVVGHDRTARAWDLESGRELMEVQFAHGLHGVAVSPDGQLIATVTTDGTATVWQPVG